MEIVYFILGISLGSSLCYFFLKSITIPRKNFEETQYQLIKKQTELESISIQLHHLKNDFYTEKQEHIELKNNLNLLKNQLTQNEVFLQKNKETIDNQYDNIKKLSLKIENLEIEKQNHIAQISHLKAENNSLENQKAEFLKIQHEAKLQFEHLANKILEEKTQKFTTLNKENLTHILGPLGENLESFRKKVDDFYQNESKERHSLDKTIRLMMEQTNRISQEANNLASALKGQTKMQGDWGEMILERILEDSGLTRGREYLAQHVIKDELGNILKPDFILKLPGNQSVIIDSKVSLVAYERMSSCDDEIQRKEHLEHHIASIKKHINTLSQKKYDHLKESLDFTIMFVPIEPAFLVAVQADNQLWNYAYSKQVILVSPTNLIAFLKLISDLWKRDDQNQNTIKIAEEGAKLYDKFVSFTENLEKIGKYLDSAQKSYDDAYKQLYSGRGNAIGRAENMKRLGLQNKTSKSLAPHLIELSENNTNNKLQFDN